MVRVVTDGVALEWKLRGLGELWNVRVVGAAALGSCLRQVEMANGLLRTNAMVVDVFGELRRGGAVMMECKLRWKEMESLKSMQERTMPRLG